MAIDIPRILKAFASNQLAKFAPGAYVKLTRQTGRGNRETETPEAIAGYFQQCIADYFDVLDIPPTNQEDFLRGKVILEYGPGDLPGVALLLVAMGAEKVYCVDRFPLVSLDEKGAAVIRHLAVQLPEKQRERFLQCLANPDLPEHGFSKNHVAYIVRPDGLSRLSNMIDLVISRAVLEHVNNLDATFIDMVTAMRPGSLSIHQVDLKSHGLHRATPLDFLEYPQWLWNFMYSHKGVPNRWRVDHYRDLLRKLPLEILDLRPTSLFNASDVVSVQGKLAAPFSQTTQEDLAWQGFWLSSRKKSG